MRLRTKVLPQPGFPVMKRLPPARAARTARACTASGRVPACACSVAYMGAKSVQCTVFKSSMACSGLTRTTRECSVARRVASRPAYASARPRTGYAHCNSLSAVLTFLYCTARSTVTRRPSSISALTSSAANSSSARSLRPRVGVASSKTSVSKSRGMKCVEPLTLGLRTSSPRTTKRLHERPTAGGAAGLIHARCCASRATIRSCIAVPSAKMMHSSAPWVHQRTK
mmetsp:Transcript_26678/g.78537  ORF Transcript_26678/g.78537 Transcript_26678/m.78537 type:complete len:227 (-) Transcript_26678:301-981(-)